METMLTVEERRAKADDVRERTMSDLMKKLKKHGRCAVVRPTGFGKTCLGTDLTKQYMKTLYCFPTQVIRDTIVNRYWNEEATDEKAVDAETMETYKRLKELPNVTLMTYAKLIRLDESELRNANYDLVIFDECHRLGGRETNKAAKKLIAFHPETHFVGMTATPVRTEGYDVIEDQELFDNTEVFTYTLHEAFQDGILLKPYYCYCTYQDENEEAHADFRRVALMAGEDVDNLKVTEVYTREVFRAAELLKMDTTIKEVCDACAPDTSQMKFIIFFSNTEHLHGKEEQVVNWFHSAYPDLPVRTLNISSETREFSDNTKELDTFNGPGISLIFAIDMMNLGYHVDNLTGIMMYRTTISDIVFIQQLGRVLSTGSNHSGIVFDVVDNLHRKGAYFDAKDTPKSTICEQDLENALHDIYVEVTQENAENNPEAEGTHQNDDKPKETLVNASDIRSEREGSSRKNCNALFQGDLITVGNYATYKELIAKTVAEPTAYRAVIALSTHFRAWCRANEIPYPISFSVLKELYGKTKHDFIRDFLNAIYKGADATGYPIRSAKQLNRIGKKRSEELTMEFCAKSQNVKVKNVMTLLGL